MRVLFALMCIFISVKAIAQEQERTILVMDGSGSMWGQIDGVAKITIAQQVVSDLLGDIPEGHELGLTVYGHRRKGDCSDIETLVTPGPGTRDAISSAVQSISPRGKTPMTDAVIAAAESLKYTEEKATVVLVSDGIETCAPDPCAAARVLERTGVDFTVHVVGFDVGDDADALAQMQCIADETGGTFHTASNATELGEALTVVAEAAPTFDVQIIATEGEGGPRIEEGIAWNVGQSDSGPWMAEEDTTAIQRMEALSEGPLFVRVVRAVDGASNKRIFVIDETTPDVLTLVLPELPPKPTEFAAQAYVKSTGKQISEGLVWSLSSADGAEIVAAQSGVDLKAGLLPGSYTVSVIRIEDEAFAERSITLDKGDRQEVVRLELPEILRPAKLVFSARLKGSNKVIRRDLTWVIQDKAGTQVHEFIGAGDSTDLMPGRYKITATRAEDGAEVSEEIALTKSGKNMFLQFTVYAALATVDAPAKAPAGSDFLVDWTGPDEKHDYVAIARRDDKDNVYSDYAYTKDGPTVELTAPSAPGDYEVRYFMAEERKVVARAPFVATPISATLAAPEEAPSGSTVAVDWTGPGYRNDYIDVSKIGSPDNKYINYRYTRDGSPAGLEMPIEPGNYQLRYIMALDKIVLATRDIVVTEEAFEVSAPAEAVAGSTIAVDWVGPDLSNDYITVANVGAKPNQHLSYAYTRRGSPADIVLPMEPGTYEIRYIVSQTKESMAAQTLTVLPLTGTLSAPESVAAGDVIEVEWAGPGYRRDYVAIAEVGSKISKYVSYEYTRKGDVLGVQAPSQPGDYELRYIAQSWDKALLASQPLTVTDVTASVSGPTSASAGSDIDIGWTGPGYRRDYVAIFPEGEEKKYLSYAYTRKGETLTLKLPDEPGSYVLRYVMGQDRRILYSTPLKIE